MCRLSFLRRRRGFAASGLGTARLWYGSAVHPESLVRVGSLPLLNLLPVVYGVPALLAAVFAGRLRARGWRNGSLVAGSVALLLLFVLVSLAVRQGFAGGVLHLDVIPVTEAEWYSYSLVWVLLGVALLVAGVAAGSTTLRAGSAVVVLVAVGKVFLLDAAQLRDLWRVLSFLGLGASLIGLGYVYQRWVFVRGAGEGGGLHARRPRSG